MATLYGMVNVPTALWIDERGKIVRPNETAYVDNRFTFMHHIESQPYLDGLRDWLVNGPKSDYAMSEEQLRQHMTPPSPGELLADANFKMGQYLVKSGHDREAIPYFKTAQKLNPDSWNYKRQAWALGDSMRDYGTDFIREVGKLKGKPYYPPRLLTEDSKDKK